LLCVVILLLLDWTTSVAQPTSLANNNYTALPIRLELSLAGGFAEIRSNHFHSGLDIRTGGKEGEPVYAPADGYVSRINISAWGGGKVLYITHPDGYRTVYMHLSAFCGKIGEFVKNYQYSNHTFAFDIDLPADSIRVCKGQMIALTGNTGGSAGPHLHYEIRLAHNDQPINPLYFGLKYNDNIAPTIAGIKLYPANSTATINNRNAVYNAYPTTVATTKKGSKNKHKTNPKTDSITVSGPFYAGIYTYDQMEPLSHNKNGVEKIELLVDGELFFRYQVPTFLFEETRIVNALIDYPHYLRTREYFILTRHLHGDRNNFSTAYRNNGYIQFDDNAIHTLLYRVSDYKGNVTTRQIQIKSTPFDTSNVAHNTFLAEGEPITYYKRFKLIRPEFSMYAEPYTVYENDQLVYIRKKNQGFLTDIHHITLKKNPLPPHQSITVEIDIPAIIPYVLRDKLTVVCTNGKKVSACATTRQGDKLKAVSRTFGGFAIQVDTIPPQLTPLNFKNNQQITSNKIKVKISDNLTGVISYHCEVNGQWQLAEHDGKTASLTVEASHLRRGNNTVKFSLSDAVGNTTIKEFTLHRK